MGRASGSPRHCQQPSRTSTTLYLASSILLTGRVNQPRTRHGTGTARLLLRDLCLALDSTLVWVTLALIQNDLAVHWWATAIESPCPDTPKEQLQGNPTEPERCMSTKPEYTVNLQTPVSRFANSYSSISRWEWTRQGMVKKLCGQSNWANAERKVIATLLGDSSDYFLPGIRYSVLSQTALGATQTPPFPPCRTRLNKQAKNIQKILWGESVRVAARSP
ncbi:hypothetical protein llap_7105 [Limosa lapponica baueri]|uniref:Uncharacterized protein n=1 Tax=Limosa lapponica baueri TaxID=1758121 RepID=A0A2I0U996_LIMLA|nr:hypothetical protein llap_7105 [Limosa lapponica baueri]